MSKHVAPLWGLRQSVLGVGCMGILLAASAASAQQWVEIESSMEYEVFANLSSLDYRKSSEVYIETVSNFRVDQRVDHVTFRSMSVIRTLDCDKKKSRVTRVRIFSEPFREGLFLGRLKVDAEHRLIPQTSLVEKLFGSFCPTQDSNKKDSKKNSSSNPQ
jgi:hypothetical protein